MEFRVIKYGGSDLMAKEYELFCKNENLKINDISNLEFFKSKINSVDDFDYEVMDFMFYDSDRGFSSIYVDLFDYIVSHFDEDSLKDTNFVGFKRF